MEELHEKNQGRVNVLRDEVKKLLEQETKREEKILIKKLRILKNDLTSPQGLDHFKVGWGGVQRIQNLYFLQNTSNTRKPHWTSTRLITRFL